MSRVFYIFLYLEGSFVNLRAGKRCMYRTKYCAGMIYFLSAAELNLATLVFAKCRKEHKAKIKRIINSLAFRVL